MDERDAEPKVHVVVYVGCDVVDPVGQIVLAAPHRLVVHLHQHRLVRLTNPTPNKEKS